MKTKTSSMTRIALMAAVMCIVGPLTIPIGAVPLSLNTLVILLAVYVLDTREGTAAVLIYLLIGAIGLPVFSGFQGGFAKIAGPTGGYLLGYILLALIAGVFIHRFYDIIWLQFLGMCLGTLVLYLSGTAWLAHVAGMTFKDALTVGVIPFIPGDISKILISTALGRAINRRTKDIKEV